MKPKTSQQGKIKWFNDVFTVFGNSSILIVFPCVFTKYNLWGTLLHFIRDCIAIQLQTDAIWLHQFGVNPKKGEIKIYNGGFMNIQ